MTDFKVLVKVNPEFPAVAVQELGLRVLGDAQAFQRADMNWVAQHDYITAVPIEIALTVDMRAVLQNQHPNTRFIITGIPSRNVAILKNEYGYVIYPSPVVEEPVEEKKQPVEKPTELCYFINGKKVSEEEFTKRKEELRQQIESVFNGMSSFLDSSIIRKALK